jgi:hypothetical protein
VNNQRTTSEQPVNTTKNEKNEKNEKKLLFLQEQKQDLVKSFKSVWDKKIYFYKNKYGNLDYYLIHDSIIEWILNNFNKAKKKKDWNLFIQRWMSKEKPQWKNKPDDIKTNIQINEYDEKAEIKKEVDKILERQKNDKSRIDKN